jgi:hypothetical protein
VAVYEALKQRAMSLDKAIPEFVKAIIEWEISYNED